MLYVSYLIYQDLNIKLTKACSAPLNFNNKLSKTPKGYDLYTFTYSDHIRNVYDNHYKQEHVKKKTGLTKECCKESENICISTEYCDPFKIKCTVSVHSNEKIQQP